MDSDYQVKAMLVRPLIEELAALMDDDCKVKAALVRRTIVESRLRESELQSSIDRAVDGMQTIAFMSDEYCVASYPSVLLCVEVSWCCGVVVSTKMAGATAIRQTFRLVYYNIEQRHVNPI